MNPNINILCSSTLVIVTQHLLVVTTAFILSKFLDLATIVSTQNERIGKVNLMNVPTTKATVIYLLVFQGQVVQQEAPCREDTDEENVSVAILE